MQADVLALLIVNIALVVYGAAMTWKYLAMQTIAERALLVADQRTQDNRQLCAAVYRLQATAIHARDNTPNATVVGKFH